MKFYRLWWLLVCLFFLNPIPGRAEDIVLPDIVVEGQKIIVPTKQSDETVYTGTEITREGMDIAGEKGKASVYEVVSVVPGVVFEGVDPNNLASEQSSIRVRGVKGYLGAMTVEGVPNYGGNPMGPRNYIYDLDNFESISIYKGAIPSDLGSGVGNRAGAIELKPLWATKDFGVKFSQSLGSFDIIKEPFLDWIQEKKDL
ncbi:MAG: TonB-dependent receptor [Desulfonauticus sp. 38_4375]|nr:MAG: TonB-dependent receptor [Desulfonauticus sp. 38_4375]